MKLRVHDLIGELCMTYEDGEALLAKLRPALIDYPQVEVDFADTRVHMSPFFNGSIAALLESYSRDELHQRLSIKNLSGNAVKTLSACLDSGEQYYHDPAYRQAVDAVMEKYAAQF